MKLFLRVAPWVPVLLLVWLASRVHARPRGDGPFGAVVLNHGVPLDARARAELAEFTTQERPLEVAERLLARAPRALRSGTQSARKRG